MVEHVRHVNGPLASVTSVEYEVGSLAGAAIEPPVYPPRSYLQLEMQPSNWPVDVRLNLTTLAHIERS